MNAQSRKFNWGKAAGLVFAVGIPAWLVARANEQVFPESASLANGMLLVTVGIALIFTVASSFASDAVKKYILIALVVLSIVLSANLVAHWVLAREMSGAKQITSARHLEEDRALDRQATLAEQAATLLDKQTELSKAESSRLNKEAVRNDSAVRLARQGLIARAPRRAALPITIPQSPLIPPKFEAGIDAAPPLTGVAPPLAVGAPALSAEEVLRKWSDRLLWFAAADLLASVVAFGICAAFWEWHQTPTLP